MLPVIKLDCANLPQSRLLRGVCRTLLWSLDQLEVSQYQSSPHCASGNRFEETVGSLLCLTRGGLSLQGSEAASKGDFLFSSDHLIEMATKLYRTTLSQTNQKLNIEISDEYVHTLCSPLFTLSFTVVVWVSTVFR